MRTDGIRSHLTGSAAAFLLCRLVREEVARAPPPDTLSVDEVPVGRIVLARLLLVVGSRAVPPPLLATFFAVLGRDGDNPDRTRFPLAVRLGPFSPL